MEIGDKVRLKTCSQIRELKGFNETYSEPIWEQIGGKLVTIEHFSNHPYVSVKRDYLEGGYIPGNFTIDELEPLSKRWL